MGLAARLGLGGNLAGANLGLLPLLGSGVLRPYSAEPGTAVTCRARRPEGLLGLGLRLSCAAAGGSSTHGGGAVGLETLPGTCLPQCSRLDSSAITRGNGSDRRQQ